MTSVTVYDGRESVQTRVDRNVRNSQAIPVTSTMALVVPPTIITMYTHCPSRQHVHRLSVDLLSVERLKFCRGQAEGFGPYYRGSDTKRCRDDQSAGGDTVIMMREDNSQSAKAALMKQIVDKMLYVNRHPYGGCPPSMTDCGVVLAVVENCGLLSHATKETRDGWKKSTRISVCLCVYDRSMAEQHIMGHMPISALPCVERNVPATPRP